MRYKEGELIKQGPEIAVSWSGKNVFELGMINHFVKDSGQFLILPQGVKTLNIIYSLLNKYVQDKLCFEEVVLPKIVPADSLRKADIFGKWDNYLLSVKPFSKTKGVKEEYMMDPLQCTAFYQYFENKTVDVSNGAIKWFDRSGPTYRNEDLDKHEPCVKQRELLRAEFVYMGTKKQVIEIRERCLEQLEKLCMALGLKYRVVVGADCYMLKEGELKYPENYNPIPVKDLEIYIPYQKKWLELAGFSILQNTLTRRFNIQGKSGEELWSGCFGLGLNRFIFVLVSYFGDDIIRHGKNSL